MWLANFERFIVIAKNRDNDNWRNINNNTIFHVFLHQTNIVIEVVDPCYFQRFIIVQNMNTLKKKCGRIHPCQIIIIVMVDLRKLFYITCLYWIQSNLQFYLNFLEYDRWIMKIFFQYLINYITDSKSWCRIFKSFVKKRQFWYTYELI